MKGHLTMSVKEVNRITIMEQLIKKEIKHKRAAAVLGLSVRQIIRLKKRYRQGGSMGLIHQGRGRKSNRQIPADEINRIIGIVKRNYWDFGPTLACEKLKQYHCLSFGVETLRKAMMAAHIWQAKRQRKPSIHQMRKRREQRGELVQIDGSPHAWFENRNKECCLLVFIDDATGELLHLRIVPVESTDAYFQAAGEYFKLHGKPLAFYSDKHNIFRINTNKGGSSSSADSNGLSQFGRAMKGLGIELISANTPQAKGRVERSNQTLQDRLVKELRLRKINNLNQANHYLSEFMKDFNRKFAVNPKNPIDAHRPLLDTEDLNAVLVRKYTRVLSKNLELQYQNQTYQILTERPAWALRRAPVTLTEDPSGNVKIYYRNRPLKHQTIAKNPKAMIIDTKRLNHQMDMIKADAEKSGSEAPGTPILLRKPAPNHPWRQSYKFVYAN